MGVYNYFTNTTCTRAVDVAIAHRPLGAGDRGARAGRTLGVGDGDEGGAPASAVCLARHVREGEGGEGCRVFQLGLVILTEGSPGVAAAEAHSHG